MIFAQYKHDTKDNTFYIEFGNTEFPAQIAPDAFKPVNATYHLENAINKAFDGKDRPEKFHLKTNDANNYYLKTIGILFLAYVKGLGFSYPDVTTENF